jgi:hypothetical protein
MDSKPFSLQSPEHIAKEYGGNKQKIASAASMGLIDPTSAVMAGMFIDRMRSAQVQEQGAPQTVAEQVFAPPAPAAPQGPPPGAPPAGLGAIAPQAPAAPPAMPAMGAPAPQAPPPPMGAPPMGQPPGMAEGGLLSVPIPDNMFDEPDNGGYAGGGIVAFAAGDEVDGEESEDELAGGDAGDNYAAFLAKQARERADKEAKNKQKNAERRDASLKGEAQPLRPKTPADGGIGPKFFASAPMAHPDGEGKELVARGKEWGDNLRANAAAADAKAKPKKPAEPGYGKIAPSPAAQFFGFIGDVNDKNAAYSARENALARKDKGLPPVADTAKPVAKAPAAPAAAKAPAAPRAPVQAAPRPQGGIMAAAQARGIGGAPAAVAPRAAGVPGAPAAPTGVVGAPTGAPGEFYGQSTDPKVQMEQLKQLAGIDPAAAQELKDYYAKTASPEAMAAQKKQDMWSSLAQIGFGMAGSNSPSFMQAAGQSASAAMPGMMQAAKDRKAAERDAMKARYDIQKGENQEKLAMASSATASAVGAAKGLEDSKWKAMDADLAERGLAQRERLAIMQENGANGRAMMQIAAANARENNVSAKDIASMRLKAYEVANDYIKANAGNPRAAKQDLDAVAAQVFANMSEGFKPRPAASAAAAGGARKPLGSFGG